LDQNTFDIVPAVVASNGNTDWTYCSFHVGKKSLSQEHPHNSADRIAADKRTTVSSKPLPKPKDTIRLRPDRNVQNLERRTIRGQNRERVAAWIFSQALPFWAKNGVDPRGGFHEILEFDGRPVQTSKRLRTMARQTYCFATAVKNKWCSEADRITRHGIEFLTHGSRTADGGFAKTFTFYGEVEDKTQDLYDYAFLLFAAAAALDAGCEEARPLGQDVLQRLDADFYLGINNGYRETAGADDSMRRANPHMHLLEAFMAWDRVTGDKATRARADQIVHLFHERFFDPETWTVREYVDRSLDPLVNDHGRLREPGHAYEWAWLLHHQCPANDRATRKTVQRLYASATTFGLNPETGLAYLVTSDEGGVLEGTSRSWAQAEAIRAAIALRQLGFPQFEKEVERRIDLLFSHHIVPAPEGCWIDRIGPTGSPVSETVPASILYHLIGAFTAYLDDEHQAHAVPSNKTR